MNDNPSYLNLRLFNDNFDDEDDDNSDNSLGLKDLHETTTIEPVDVDIEPITPPDFNMTAVTKDDIKTLLESHETKKLSTIQPKTFSGRVDENPHNFMSHFEAYAKLTSLEGENKCLTFGLMLQDVALCWYESLSDDDKKDFDVLKQKFTDTYMSKSKNWIYTQDLEGRKLMPGERAEAYITDIIKRTNKLGLDDTQVMQYIIRGLSPQLKGELISHNPSNLAETIERVYLAESALKLKSQETVQHLDTINHLANITTTMNTLDKKIEDISKGMHQTSTHDRQHPQQRQQDNGMQYPARQQRQNVASGGCYICGKNHLARHCWYRPGNGQPNQQRPSRQYERQWRPRNNGFRQNGPQHFQQQNGAQHFQQQNGAHLFQQQHGPQPSGGYMAQQYQQPQVPFGNNQNQPWNAAATNYCPKNAYPPRQ